MNQILEISLKKKKINNHEIIFKILLIFSLLFLLILIGIFILGINNLIKNQKLSNRLINNYTISNLYHSSTTNSNLNNDSNELFGIIEIPNINIKYPVFSTLSDENLKISPCKFYGTNPLYNGNICIART